jgi:cell division inhibitor SepF
VQEVETVFARRLRETREAAGLSQVRLAALLADQAGMELDPTAITRIERGQRGIALREAYSLAHVLGVPLEYLCRPYPQPEAEQLSLALQRAKLEYAEAEAEANSARHHLAEIAQQVQALEAELDAARASEAEDAARHEPAVIAPRDYQAARAIGERLRAGTPVILNLDDVDDSDARRLIDFAAGLIFATYGSIDKVRNRAFVLSPSRASHADGTIRAAERAGAGPAQGDAAEPDEVTSLVSRWGKVLGWPAKSPRPG